MRVKMASKFPKGSCPKHRYNGQMSRLARPFTLFLTLSLFGTLTACELTGDKRKLQTEEDASVLISIFFSNQYASDNTSVRDFFSFFSGVVAASNSKMNTERFTNPPVGCSRTVEAQGLANYYLGIQRILNIGTLSLVLPEDAVAELKRTENLDYYYENALLPGSYVLKSLGTKNGTLKFDQPFEVMQKGGNIRVFSYLNSNDPSAVSEQLVASPHIPSPSDLDYKVVFNRLSNNYIRFDAPEGTSYVRARLREGPNPTSNGDYTCYSEPDQALEIPAGKLFGFSAGNQGHLEVDFIKVSEISDKSVRLHSSTIISTVRHFQGTFEYTTQEGLKVTQSIGQVEFR